MRSHRLRQAVAALLVVMGVALLLLAPSAGPGLVAFALGVLIEAVGLALERRDPRAR
jgi:drug/metabolite transporter (DMT)-like permease